MAQYQTGTVSVTNGSQTVTGLGTEWLANVSVGDVFKINGVNITVAVGAIGSDTSITLAANWSGSTMADKNYTITRDFEPTMGYREVWHGDKDWPFHLTETIRAIATDIACSYIATTVTSDTLWEDVVPAGYMLEYVVLENTTGNTATLSMGTTDNDDDVFSLQSIPGNDITVVEIKDVYSMSVAQDLDINDSGGGNWNSATLNVYLLMRKIS